MENKNEIEDKKLNYLSMKVFSQLLYVHVSWCFWHEGTILYDLNSDLMREVITLRNEIMSLQSHNPTAQAIISKASNNELLEVLKLIEPQVEQEHYLFAHFSWVADHEGQRSDFYNLLVARDFIGIRRKYKEYQNHNSDARNLLCCVSNLYLENLINSI